MGCLSKVSSNCKILWWNNYWNTHPVFFWVFPNIFVKKKIFRYKVKEVQIDYNSSMVAQLWNK